MLLFSCSLPGNEVERERERERVVAIRLARGCNNDKRRERKRKRKRKRASESEREVDLSKAQSIMETWCIRNNNSNKILRVACVNTQSFKMSITFFIFRQVLRF